VGVEAHGRAHLRVKVGVPIIREINLHHPSPGEGSEVPPPLSPHLGREQVGYGVINGVGLVTSRTEEGTLDYLIALLCLHF
jgi:hypothetical protein